MVTVSPFVERLLTTSYWQVDSTNFVTCKLEKDTDISKFLTTFLCHHYSGASGSFS